jgi:hypothetical protein
MTDYLDQLINHRPMSLERIDTALMLGDCVAVCEGRDDLREWYRDGMEMIAELMNATRIGAEISELGQHPSQAQETLRTVGAYTL